MLETHLFLINGNMRYILRIRPCLAGGCKRRIFVVCSVSRTKNYPIHWQHNECVCVEWVDVTTSWHAVITKICCANKIPTSVVNKRNSAYIYAARQHYLCQENRVRHSIEDVYHVPVVPYMKICNKYESVYSANCCLSIASKTRKKILNGFDERVDFAGCISLKLFVFCDMCILWFWLRPHCMVLLTTLHMHFILLDILAKGALQRSWTPFIPLAYSLSNVNCKMKQSFNLTYLFQTSPNIQFFVSHTNPNSHCGSDGSLQPQRIPYIYIYSIYIYPLPSAGTWPHTNMRGMILYPAYKTHNLRINAGDSAYHFPHSRIVWPK